MTGQVCADDVVRALYRHFVPRYAVITELTITDSEVAAAWDLIYARQAHHEVFDELGTSKRTRRCDMLLVAPGDRIMVEVKVSRADFLTDLRDSRKHTAWQQMVHRWAYATPAGLIKPDEVPDGWGLVEVGDGPVRWTRRAPRHRAKSDVLPDLPWPLLLARLSYAEATLRGHAHGATDDVEKVRAEAQALTRTKDRLLNRVSRVETERDYYKRLAAHLGGGWPCSTCGRPVRPKSIQSMSRWVHRQADEAACEPLRRARLITDARERWEALTPERRQNYLRGDMNPALVLASWAHDSGPRPVEPGWDENEGAA